MLKIGRSNEEKASSLQTAGKVMVVENDKWLLAYAGDSLKSHSFEVTCINGAGDALRILTKREAKYDLLFVGGKLKEVDIITFLRITKNMNIPTMVMHEEADEDFVFNMIENGALRVVKRPLSADVLIHARRCVRNERLKKFGELKSNRPAVGKKVRRSHAAIRNSNVQLHEHEGFCVKMSLEWTKELHSEFLRAALKLAKEGNCTPKNILNEMGVPELTRTQVASHLQKWRLALKKLQGNVGSPKTPRLRTSNAMPGRCIQFRD